MARRLLTLIVLAVCLAPLKAQPASGRISALADASALVLTGRVQGLGTASDGVAIYTYVTLDVAAVLKGPVPDGPITLKVLGGVRPDLGLFIADQARFEEGEDVLLFLGVRPRDATLYPVGLSRGKWRVLSDLATKGLAAVNGADRLPLDDTLASVVRTSRPHDARFVRLPAEHENAAPNFTLIPPGEGGPARWHEADDGTRIPVDYQTIPPGLPGGGSDQLNGAIGAWNGVGTRLQLERAATGSPTCPAQTFTANGRIGLYWNDPCGEIADDDPLTFGVGGGYFTPGFQRTINGVTFNKFIQGLAILNNQGPHLVSAACLQDAVAHVLGHAVGLGHSSDGGAVMYATLRTACTAGATGLGSDDIDGIRFIYPAVASGGRPPDAPTAITNSVVLDSVTLAWTPATTGGPAQSYVLEAGSEPRQANLATLVLNSPATSATVGGVAPGTYHVRVRARNALGTSPPSPDTTVTVGPCTAPGVPGNLTYTTADNIVTLSWTPPSTGITQGYWLFAGLMPGQSNALVAPLGPVTSFSGAGPYGTYYVRLAARNSCAVGPVTSPDLVVNLSRCTSAPEAPVNLSATQNGNLVTLSWSPPASGNLPSRYEVHAGSATGASNRAVVVTGHSPTTLTATAAPSTYWVRVYGRNECGLGPASNEIRVEVP